MEEKDEKISFFIVGGLLCGVGVFDTRRPVLSYYFLLECLNAWFYYGEYCTVGCWMMHSEVLHMTHDSIKKLIHVLDWDI